MQSQDGLIADAAAADIAAAGAVSTEVAMHFKILVAFPIASAYSQ
ncbi:hypothetical protein [Tomitella cavernea]|uniref:Uncharacterized protein n=1 Tax=Tomitella cavernea TaxID=1387982 RepID=A0ABP9CXE2_9ACTN